MQQHCDVCGGKGKVITAKCSSCKGTKLKRGSSQRSVSVEKGMRDGQTIVLEGESDQSPDYTAGDVIFTIRTAPHPIYSRQGNNLKMTATITLRQALLGFKKIVTDLGGKKFEISRKGVTPPGTNANAGFVQHMPSLGMPKADYSLERGDLFVEYQILFPATLSASEQKRNLSLN